MKARGATMSQSCTSLHLSNLKSAVAFCSNEFCIVQDGVGTGGTGRDGRIRFLFHFVRALIVHGPFR